MAAKIVAIEHLTLDGVYQAPGRADEDNRNGFTHGGWSTANDSPETQGIIGKYMAGGWSLLVGATTYDDLYQSWPIGQPSSPMTKALTGVQKFVVSRNAQRALPWANSELLSGEASEKVAQLKFQSDKTLVIFGSGVLVRSLMESRLVDEFVLMIHPLVVGKGFRFFDESTPFTKLRLNDKLITSTGVVVGIYGPSAS